MKYPITPEYLNYAPKELIKLFLSFEQYVLIDIVKRLNNSGEITSTAIEQIKVLKRTGISQKQIESAISKLSSLSEKQLDKLFKDAVKRNEEYSKNILAEKYDAERMTATVNAIKKQTNDEIANITRSLGFVFKENGNLVITPLAKTYQHILDKAMLQIDMGATDYQTAIRNATKELADSGLQFIDYDSGWHNRVDVAVRRAINTGISQMSAKYTEQNMEQLDTKLVEVTAHMGARDTDGPHGWENHAKWQGKVYKLD